MCLCNRYTVYKVILLQYILTDNSTEINQTNKNFLGSDRKSHTRVQLFRWSEMGSMDGLLLVFGNV